MSSQRCLTRRVLKVFVGLALTVGTGMPAAYAQSGSSGQAPGASPPPSGPTSPTRPLLEAPTKTTWSAPKPKSLLNIMASNRKFLGTQSMLGIETLGMMDGSELWTSTFFDPSNSKNFQVGFGYLPGINLGQWIPLNLVVVGGLDAGAASHGNGTGLSASTVWFQYANIPVGARLVLPWGDFQATLEYTLATNVYQNNAPVAQSYSKVGAMVAFRGLSLGTFSFSGGTFDGLGYRIGLAI